METCIPKDIIADIEQSGVFAIKDSVEREMALSKFFNPTEARRLNIKFEKTKTLKDTESSFDKVLDKFLKGETAEGLAKKNELKAKMKETFRLKKEKLEKLMESGEVRDADIINIEKLADDIVAEKYGYNLKAEQVDKIVTLTNDIKAAKALPEVPSGITGVKGSYDLKYGQAIETLRQYKNTIINPGDSLPLKKALKLFWNMSKEEFTELGSKKAQAAYIASKLLRGTTSPAFKNLKATADLSVQLIQGVAVLMRNPRAYVTSTKNSLKAAFAKNPDEMASLFRAKRFSDKYYDDAVLGGARLGSREEQIVSSAPERIGIIKRADAAFQEFLENARLAEYKRARIIQEKKMGRELDLNDSNLEQLIDEVFKEKIKGKNLPEKELSKIRRNIEKNIIPDSTLNKELADHANKVSGTSNLDPAEMYASALNRGFFAPRFMVSDVKMWTDPLKGLVTGSTAARNRAAETLGLNIAGTFGTYALISTMLPDRTELRPNHPNFMRIKGDEGTWSFPSTKGLWMIKLISKLIANAEYDSRGNKIEYGEGYKPKTRLTTTLRAARSKLAPGVGTITSLLDGKSFMGEKMTPLRTVSELTLPIAGGEALNVIMSDKSLMTKIQASFFQILGGQFY